MRIKELLRKEINDDKAKNISDLSRKIGLPYTTLREIYKTGGENIKVQTLIKIAQYLNVSTDYLLGLSNFSCDFINETNNECNLYKSRHSEYIDDEIWMPVNELAFEESMDYFIEEFRDRLRKEFVDNGGKLEWRKRKEVAKDPYIDIETVGVGK